MTTTIETTLLIAGAGIGGLTTALALHAHGQRDMLVLEAAARIRPLGVGINIQPAAVAELYALGLNRALERTAVQTECIDYLDSAGQRLWSEPRGLRSGSRYPQLSIHRGALELVLLRALKTRLGRAAIRTGARIISFSESNDGSVEAIALDQSTGKPIHVRARGLIGADGIHSAIRAQLQGDENEVVRTPVMMWRGTTEMSRFLDGRTMIVASDNGETRLIAYPISSAHARRGMQLVNWVCMVSADTRTRHARPDWSETANIADVLPYFAHWRFDWLDIERMLTSSRVVLQYPMVDRDPLPRWGTDRVTLLGDAAHLMYPVGANGASQTILDASTLAFELAHQPEIAVAFGNYERARRPVTTRVVHENRVRDRMERVVAGAGDAQKSAVLESIVSRYKQNVEGR